MEEASVAEYHVHDVHAGHVTMLDRCDGIGHRDAGKTGLSWC